MTTPQDPKDPASLSLKPSSGRGGNADFSNVQGGSDTVPDRSGSPSGGRPDFSNVQGRADTVPDDGRSPGFGAQTHTVESGDTLSAIAKQYYGKASRWNAIFEANRDQLDDPDRIRPGQVLKIPADD